MDCLKFANENGIRTVLVVQAVSRILDEEQMALFTKYFKELLAFLNHEDELQPYTENLMGARRFIFR